MHALADQHATPSAIYRKLMLESRKKVEHNIDIAPQICLAIMFIAILWTVSLSAITFHYI